MLDELTFRQTFPVFTDNQIYPTAQFNFWLEIAVTQLNECRWADLYTHGLSLFVAHYLVLYAREAEAFAQAGASATGRVEGLETSKSVDKISVSMDVSAVSFADAGHWNQTTYGIQFYQLVRIVGAGGVQL